jgi:hypothetical protein
LYCSFGKTLFTPVKAWAGSNLRNELVYSCEFTAAKGTVEIRLEFATFEVRGTSMHMADLGRQIFQQGAAFWDSAMPNDTFLILVKFQPVKGTVHFVEIESEFFVKNKC